jgi:hypothetical protein
MATCKWRESAVNPANAADLTCFPAV